MTGLDTNILARYLLHDDPGQYAIAAEVIENLTLAEPGFVSLVTIVELVWVLSRVYGNAASQIADAVEGLLAVDTMTLQNEEEIASALAQCKAGAASFADALVAALGSWAGCETTLTFDKAAARLPGITLARSRPMA